MNHILIILTFTIIQFLYVISCLIIPIYLDENEIKEQNELNNDNITIGMISGSHDKYIKFWA